MTQSPCKKDPVLFHTQGPPGSPDSEGQQDYRNRINRALRICRTKCPVQEECLEYAIELKEESFGIWGGMLPDERRNLRRQRDRQRLKAERSRTHDYS